MSASDVSMAAGDILSIDRRHWCHIEAIRCQLHPFMSLCIAVKSVQLFAVRLCKGLCETSEIPTGPVNQQSIVIEAIPTYIWNNQSQMGDTS